MLTNNPATRIWIVSSNWRSTYEKRVTNTNHLWPEMTRPPYRLTRHTSSPCFVRETPSGIPWRNSWSPRLSTELISLGLHQDGEFIWPPVDFRIDDTPHVLVTSPRHVIERDSVRIL